LTDLEGPGRASISILLVNDNSPAARNHGEKKSRESTIAANSAELPWSYAKYNRRDRTKIAVLVTAIRLPRN
jgi:hypothetical protein